MDFGFPGRYMLMQHTLVLSGFAVAISQSDNTFFDERVSQLNWSCVDLFAEIYIFIVISCRYLMHENRMEKTSAQRIYYVDHGYIVNIHYLRCRMPTAGECVGLCADLARS